MSARKKPRTARAVAANQGVQREYAKRLQAVLRAVVRDAFLELKDAAKLAGMAQDADEPSPIAEQAQRFVHERFAEAQARWLVKAGMRAKEVSRWYCRQLYRTTTAAQKKALIAAGMNKAVLDDRWTIPVLGRQHISASAAKHLDADIKANTELITKMAARDLGRLQDLLSESASRGVSFSEMEGLLRASEGFDEARAKRVALDQTNKLNQQIQRDNARDLGITKCIWVHVPGKYTSRHTHMAMNGKTFDVNEGLFDSDVGRNVLPGELPMCRCQSRLCLPEELFND
ncbi:MAG: phage minor head protein [Succinivibrio sp.]|nr:phage minor head protein [Succinivibrio sp.]